MAAQLLSQGGKARRLAGVAAHKGVVHSRAHCNVALMEGEGWLEEPRFCWARRDKKELKGQSDVIYSEYETTKAHKQLHSDRVFIV